MVAPALEKRNTHPPIPSNLGDYLNEDQQLAIDNLSQFGWTLEFIRRPPFHDRTVVLFHSDGNSIGVLEEDGRINVDTDIVLRH